MMNRFERRPIDAGEAKIEFVDGEYRIVRPGAFVRCAVTGEPIPLEELRYWSVDWQEAYSSTAASMKRDLRARLWSVATATIYANKMLSHARVATCGSDWPAFGGCSSNRRGVLDAAGVPQLIESARNGELGFRAQVALEDFAIVSDISDYIRRPIVA